MLSRDNSGFMQNLNKANRIYVDIGIGTQPQRRKVQLPGTRKPHKPHTP